MPRLVLIVLVLLLAGGCNQAALCPYTNDGECDDGRPGADSNACDPGTDAVDCADVDPTICNFTNDGECDDGRPGSVSSICTPGTDEADCAGLPEA